MIDCCTRRLLTGALAAGALAGCGPSGPQAVAPAGFGEIHRYDGRLDAAIAPDAVIERIAEGFSWTEGPAWSDEDEALLLTDTGVEALYSWSRADGVERLAPPAPLAGARAIGLAAGPDGRIYYADARGGLGVWDRAANEASTLADRFEGAAFNGVNDVAVGPDGAVYMTDTGARATAETRTQPVNGVYRILASGDATLVSDALEAPNGVAISPLDGAVYVTNTLASRPVVVRLGASIENPADAVFDAATAPSVEGGTTLDGLAIDAAGRLYVASNAGVWVVAPDGATLGLIDLDRPTSNVTIAEGMLYITAANILARVELEGR